MALVAPEAPSEQARRVFQTYDPEGKNPVNTSYIFMSEILILGLYSKDELDYSMEDRWFFKKKKKKKKNLRKSSENENQRGQPAKLQIVAPIKF